MDIKFDFAVLGAGFGGSLTALLLDRIGMQVVLIDRGRHPRFAIGESSTPTADFVLRDLCQRFDLPRLEPLTSYGSWQASYPDLVCGVKRGFSYFHHEPGKPFKPRHDHANELLVAASADEFHADTHWLRSDTDAFIAQEVTAAGIPYFDQTHVTLVPTPDGWQITAQSEVSEKVTRIQTRFLIDATGAAGEVLRVLGVASDRSRLHTNSRAIFAHFRQVPSWKSACHEPFPDHPFDCDQSAQHHVIDEGWMWQLRFGNGVTSAGFVLDHLAVDPPNLSGHQLPGMSQQSSNVGALDEWRILLSRYPSLHNQFQDASLIAPATGLQRTNRLQRMARQMAGSTWAALPHTAGFIDPLHSTGIAHTLIGIERLIDIFEEHWAKSTLTPALQGYETRTRAEFELIDELVSGCYWSRSNFRAFSAHSMLYFAAATAFEHARRSNRDSPESTFLNAANPAFRETIHRLHKQLKTMTQAGKIGEDDALEYEREVARAIQPFNRVGLCDPAAQNMYAYTVAMK